MWRTSSSAPRRSGPSSPATRPGGGRDVLKRITHTSTADMIDLYTSMSWEEMCKAVLCLELGLKEEDEATEEEAAKGKDATEEKEATEGKEATVELKAAKEAGRVPI